MSIQTRKIKEFTDLLAWQESHKVVLTIYKIIGDFPRSEMYSIVDQMRRSATSITSNIAEGFGRRTYREKVQFYYMAQGSLTELRNQLIISRDVGYLRSQPYLSVNQQLNIVHQLLQGLITKSKSFINHTS